MIEKAVSFKNRSGGKVVGDLLIPSGEGPFPSIILIHGFKGHRNRPLINELAKILEKNKFLTLRVDLTGNPGESDLQFEDMTPTLELEEVEAAYNFLISQEEADKNKIGLVGHSLGGYLVSKFTALNPEKVKSVIPLAPVFDFAGFVGYAFDRKPSEVEADFRKKGWAYVWSTSENRNLKLKDTFYRDILEHYHNDFASKITSPILIIHGDTDEVVSFSHGERYFKKASAQNKKLENIEGADHGFSRPEHFQKMSRAVVNWFKNTLG